MRPDDCRRCDRASERSAELIVQLRRTALELHKALGHETRSFFDCDQPPCRANAAVAQGRRRS